MTCLLFLATLFAKLFDVLESINMTDMFRHYPQPDDYKPDNYPKCRVFKPVEIMCGETAVHTFEVPFNVKEKCSMCEVIYKLGLDPIVIKSSLTDLEVEVTDQANSFVTCVLKPADTLAFRNTALETKVQLKFYMNDKTVSYSEIYKVYVKDALDANGRKAINSKGMIAGLGSCGYTED